MSTNITLQEVALASAPTLYTLYGWKSQYPTQDKRIGINERGAIVIFKGNRYRLHPDQCRRAWDLMVRENLTAEPKAAVTTWSKNKGLRMGSAPVVRLLNQLKPHMPTDDGKVSCFTSILDSASEPVPAPAQQKCGPRKSAFRSAIASLTPTRQRDSYQRLYTSDDDNTESNAWFEARTKTLQALTEQLRREYLASRNGDDHDLPDTCKAAMDACRKPSLSPKKDRDTLIRNVGKLQFSWLNEVRKSLTLGHDVVPDKRPLLPPPPKPPRKFPPVQAQRPSDASALVRGK
ncbi:hypothetical protein UC34_01100 [Pandoraea vervacti]|uniref:Uncharacterized protein n=1 Tax=Pandoraea vervacti TaxID=656178 RepID=A0ABN4FKW2_9BURK|nr:hypothetical protein [Pandoraea vervacti]AJP55966.1 hypothetical protein UC34_01100 [Pandoraea vervacti]